jgi:hypothetical protein
MAYPSSRQLPPPWSSFDKSDLQEIGFYHVFEGRFFLSEYRGKSSDTYRASVEIIFENCNIFAIKDIQSEMIYSDIAKNIF